MIWHKNQSIEYNTQFTCQKQAFSELLFRLHAFQLPFLICRKISRIKSVPDFRHHCIIKIQIMQYAKTHSQHLPCLKQMPDVSPGIPPAGRTPASLLDRTLIQLIFGIEKIDLSAVCVQVSVSSVSGRIHAREFDS